MLWDELAARVKPYFNIDTIRGPWFSIGFHIDFEKPYLDIHFIWWIITVGKYPHMGIEVVEIDLDSPAEI